MQWFDVDKEGLAALIQRRGAASAVVELVQNALDTDATEVNVTLVATGDGIASLIVEDNDPHGFDNLAHAFTLFAPSEKKANVHKRGRFNLGEKLVLALCEWAQIKSTKGTIIFGPEGRTEDKRSRRRAGSLFSAAIYLDKSDIAQVENLCHRLLLPKGINVIYNGVALATRTADLSWRDILPTEVADGDGILKATRRKTTLSIYTPQPGEQPHLYELGIPVVEIDGGYHVNIGQKVPLNFERNNVTPAYLRAVQLSVVNNCTALITDSVAAQGWVSDALSSDKISPDAVRAILQAKYGVSPDRLVRFDPSDPDSRNEAHSQGLTVVGGRAFTPDQWKSIDRAGVVKPAGQVTPSRQTTASKDAAGSPECATIDLTDLTEVQQGTVRYVGELAAALLGAKVTVEVVKDQRKYAASWGTRRSAPLLRLNTAHLSKAWWSDQIGVDEIVLHEVAHHFCADHLSHNFYEAGFRLGAQARTIALCLEDFVPVKVTAGKSRITVGID